MPSRGTQINIWWVWRRYSKKSGLYDYAVIPPMIKELYQKIREGINHIQSVPGGTDKLRESVPYVKIYRYNPKHLYPKLNGYGDNGQRTLKV